MRKNLGLSWVSIFHAFADVRMSLTHKDSDQALELAVLLPFSFPRLALCWNLVYLVKHPSQQSICGCWISSGVLCRFVMFNRQCGQASAPHGWSLDHNPGHRATVLSGFIPLFFFPLLVPALFFWWSFQAPVSCFTKGSLCLFFVFFLFLYWREWLPHQS